MKTRAKYNYLPGVVGLVLAFSFVLALPTVSRADLANFPYFTTDPDSKAEFPATKTQIEALLPLGTVYEADRVRDKATGADMKGMTVTAVFAGGASESLRWDLLGEGTFAGVSGTGWSLRVDADLDTWYPGYGFKNYYGIWELVNNTGSNLLRLELDGTTFNSEEDELPVFFDLSETADSDNRHYGGETFGTLGSTQGGTFVPVNGNTSDADWDWLNDKVNARVDPDPDVWPVDVVATYTRPVWNAEFPAEDMPGDLWANVAIEFGSMTSGTLNRTGLGSSSDSTYHFGLDTDVVPVPGAVLLGAMGLGMVGWMKRRKQEA